ncbi:MAG: hypothetical protein GY729_16785 [Desulfobacteraceae bacterium]|nr:hypothetical protein [Desulfobacteraceae bacterium]
MFTRLGIYSLLIGFFIAIFSTISKFMNQDNIWVNMTIAKLMGDKASPMVESIGNESVQELVRYFLFQLPVFGLILGLGGLFFIISFFMKEN